MWHQNGRFFETVRFQLQIGHQLLELPVLPLELLYLLPSGVPYRVTRKPLLAGLHELLGPRVVGVRLDHLPPAQVIDRDLPAEALQHDADLLFRAVLTPGRRPHPPYELPGLLAALFCSQLFVCI